MTADRREATSAQLPAVGDQSGMARRGVPPAVVVIGASGFVGRNLVEALAGTVKHLIGVTGSALDVPGCTVTVTLDTIDGLPSLPDGTVVVHLAAHRYDASRTTLVQSDILAGNADITSRVFRFCAARGIRELRLASSVAVYGQVDGPMDDAVPVDLATPPHPHEAFYAWSKRWAEIHADLYRDRYGLHAVTMRLANPYGPHDSIVEARAHVAPAFVMRALNADPTFVIRGDATVTRDFTYVGDVVDVILRTLEWRGVHGAWNVCTGTNLTLADLAREAMHAAGREKPIVADAPGAFGPAHRVATSARIVEATGVRFRSLAEGMVPTMGWYRHVLGR